MRILIRQHQSPGDILMVTAAVRDLARAVPPPLLRIGVETTCQELWANNPYIDPRIGLGAGQDRPDRVLDLEYPQINFSDRLPYHFVHAFRQELELRLARPIPQGEFHGDLHLSAEEREPSPLLGGWDGPYWLLDAGFKSDYTLKNWGSTRFQRLVELLDGRVRFVQIGARHPGHFHPRLEGVIDCVDKTPSTRDLIRLMYRAQGVVTPVSFPMHLSAAVPTTDGGLRPCVVLNGGREPPQWVQYPGHVFLHCVGQMDCCRHGGCWRSRAAPLNDGDEKDRRLCAHPVRDPDGQAVGRCMADFAPELVASVVALAAARLSPHGPGPAPDTIPPAKEN